MVMGAQIHHPIPSDDDGWLCEIYEYKWIETNAGKELIAEYRRTEAW